MPPGSRCSFAAKTVESGSRIGRREGKKKAERSNKTTALTPVVFCADRKVQPCLDPGERALHRPSQMPFVLGQDEVKWSKITFFFLHLLYWMHLDEFPESICLSQL